MLQMQLKCNLDYFFGKLVERKKKSEHIEYLSSSVIGGMESDFRREGRFYVSKKKNIFSLESQSPWHKINKII